MGFFAMKRQKSTVQQPLALGLRGYGMARKAETGEGDFITANYAKHAKKERGWQPQRRQE
jgi:hypothetical protein